MAGPNPLTVEEAAVNPIATFTVDDSMAEMRRVVVDEQNCAKCHGEFSKEFSIHGNLRNQTQYCVLCHNPNGSDVDRRKLDPAAVASASLGPIQSVCTSCHDGEDAAAHAQTNTAADGAEACPVCHEEGRPFAVSTLHARGM